MYDTHRQVILIINLLYWQIVCKQCMERVDGIMVFNVTFSYIVAVSIIRGGNRSTLRKLPTCRKSQTLSHNVVSSTPRHERGSNWTLVVIWTDCMGSCKSNHHTIMATMAQVFVRYIYLIFIRQYSCSLSFTFTQDSWW